MKKRAPSRGRAAPLNEDSAAPPRWPSANTYLYGIVPAPVPAQILKAAGPGVGDPPREVRALRSGDLAALVSDVSAAELSGQGVRGLRRDMKAHSAVLNAVAANTTVLPARFGVVLPGDAALVAEFLGPRRKALNDSLTQLDGAVEVTLRATYVEEQILRQVLETRPELQGGRGGRSGSMATESRIELGRQVAAAIQDEQERDAGWLLGVLGPVVRDMRVGKPLSDLMVLNASLLVERGKLPKFDRLLDNVNAEVGHRMTFDCVGPLPPFSFVDLRL